MSNMVELRKTAESAGQQVGFDPHTKIVSVGNQQFTPQQLQGMGGQIVNDRWHLPQQAMQGIISQQTPPAHIPQQGGWNQQQAMSDMQGFMQQQSVGFLQQQQAQLQIMMESQIAQLKMAYEQAIADGQISIRDAEAQFQQQVKQIQQQAYQDAERTALYAHDMGIQNSQQMVGLMQGDNARKNSMINENMTTRDRRINDIKDRLNAIKMNKNIELNRINAEYQAGLLSASGQAQQMYAQGMFGLMQDDYKANLGQQFAQQNMATQHSYNSQLANQAHQQRLVEMLQANELDIQKMELGQKFDLQKISIAFKNDLSKMATQHGYNMSAMSKEQSNALARIEAQLQKELEREKVLHDRETQRIIASGNENTPEGRAMKVQLEQIQRKNVMDIYTNALTEAVIISTFENAPPIGVTPKEPQVPISPAGWLFNYPSDKKEYEKQLEAIKRREKLMENPYEFIFGK